jgi:glycosyltransferase involved in cell wall biosynthesis
MKTPVISVIFLTYNQESYVRQALRSVLNQDYDDYEIIIGDDDSSDGTPGIIQSEVEGYRGKAKIVIAPREKNLGIIRNYNRCVALSSGRIIVGAAGDDVSYPERLRRVADFFGSHPNCYAYYCNARIVDAKGGVIRPAWYGHTGVIEGEFSPNSYHLYQGIQFCGATASYRADLCRKFPPMFGVYGGEDGPFIIRSLLLGSAAVDSSILMDWRWHGANVSHGGRAKGLDWKAKLRRCAAWPAGQKVHRRGYLRDISYALAAGMISESKAKRMAELTTDLHAQASLKFHCTHPNGKWSAVATCVSYYWRVSPRGLAWKMRFVAKALAKKLLPGPLRAVVLFNFSKF